MDVRRTSKSVAVSHDTGYAQLGVYPHSLNMDHPAPTAIVPKSVLVFAVLFAEHTLGLLEFEALAQRPHGEGRYEPTDSPKCLLTLPLNG